MKHQPDYRPASRRTSTILFFVTLLLFSCSDDGEQSPKKKLLVLKRHNLYTISTGKLAVNLSCYFQPENSELVYFLNPSSYHFQVLNLSDGRLKLVGVLPEIPEFDGFIVEEKARKLYVFSTDSVMIYTFRGDRTDAFALPETANGYVYQSGNYFPPVIENGKLYLSYFPKTEHSFRNPAYFKAPVEAEIDLQTKNVKLLPQGYPAIYQQHCYSYHYDASRFRITRDVHAYTFPHSDSVYLYNTKTGERSTRFFGALVQKQFAYIPFEQIPKLHETVFDQLVQKNPHYSFPTALPLAGYYSRELMIAPKKAGDVFEERIILFDNHLNYIGESVFRPDILLDSKKGVLSMRMENTQLLIDRLSW